MLFLMAGLPELSIFFDLDLSLCRVCCVATVAPVGWVENCSYDSRGCRYFGQALMLLLTIKFVNGSIWGVTVLVSDKPTILFRQIFIIRDGRSRLALPLLDVDCTLLPTLCTGLWRYIWLRQHQKVASIRSYSSIPHPLNIILPLWTVRC